jgi:hypothetical protein
MIINDRMCNFICKCGKTSTRQLEKNQPLPILCKRCRGEQPGRYTNRQPTSEFNVYCKLMSIFKNHSNFDKWKGDEGFLVFLKDVGKCPSKNHFFFYPDIPNPKPEDFKWVYRAPRKSPYRSYPADTDPISVVHSPNATLQPSSPSSSERFNVDEIHVKFDQLRKLIPGVEPLSMQVKQWLKKASIKNLSLYGVICHWWIKAMQGRSIKDLSSECQIPLPELHEKLSNFTDVLFEFIKNQAAPQIHAQPLEESVTDIENKPEFLTPPLKVDSQPCAAPSKSASIFTPPIPTPRHKEFFDLLKGYYATGGTPRSFMRIFREESPFFCKNLDEPFICYLEGEITTVLAQKYMIHRKTFTSQLFYFYNRVKAMGATLPSVQPTSLISTAPIFSIYHKRFYELLKDEYAKGETPRSIVERYRKEFPFLNKGDDEALIDYLDGMRIIDISKKYKIKRLRFQKKMQFFYDNLESMLEPYNLSDYKEVLPVQPVIDKVVLPAASEPLPPIKADILFQDIKDTLNLLIGKIVEYESLVVKLDATQMEKTYG